MLHATSDLLTLSPIGAHFAQGRSVCENGDRKEVTKVYLECGNCFERVEREPADDSVRKHFNNGSVEYFVTCPTCGYGNMIIDLPIDDYEFSTKVFDNSEALNNYDLELLTRYDQGMRLS